MKFRFVTLIIFLFGWAPALVTAIDKTTPFVNSVALQGADQFMLFWNYTTTTATFKIVVKNALWVGLGWSPNGQMNGGSAVVAYFNSNNGTVNFTSRSTDDGVAKINRNSFADLLFIDRANGVMTVIFSRNLTLCPKIQNTTDNIVNIVSGTQYLIWAWGSSLRNNDISYHGPNNRGSVSIALINTINQPVDLNMSEITTAEIFVNTTLVNNAATEYYCAMFSIPPRWQNVKQHLVRVEVLTPPSSLKYVHHWTLNECSPQYETVFLKDNNNLNPVADACYLEGRSTPSDWAAAIPYCQRTSLIWGTGSPMIFDFPTNLAYPIGGSNGSFKYFYLQIHYNNPGLDQNVTDTTGLRFYVTEKYRQTEIGIFTLGTDSTWRGILLPPKMERVSIDYYCRKEMLKGLFSKGNITVFAVAPHAHLAGKEIYVTQIRNGKEIAYLANNKYFSFSVQSLLFLQKPIILTANDELKATCVYQTINKTSYTIGGPATTDEMCSNYIWYYPKNDNIASCYDYLTPEAGQSLIKALNNTGEIKISGPLTDENIVTSLRKAKPTLTSTYAIPFFYQTTKRMERNDFNLRGQSMNYDAYFVEPIAETNRCLI